MFTNHFQSIPNQISYSSMAAYGSRVFASVLLLSLLGRQTDSPVLEAGERANQTARLARLARRLTHLCPQAPLHVEEGLHQHGVGLASGERMSPAGWSLWAVHPSARAPRQPRPPRGRCAPSAPARSSARSGSASPWPRTVCARGRGGYRLAVLSANLKASRLETTPIF